MHAIIIMDMTKWSLNRGGLWSQGQVSLYYSMLHRLFDNIMVLLMHNQFYVSVATHSTKSLIVLSLKIIIDLNQGHMKNHNTYY